MKKSISVLFIAMMIISIIFVACIPKQYTLTTDVAGNGSITLDPSGGIYDEGTTVTVEAIADAGWTFDSWSGDLSGSANPTTITMDGDKSITATFLELFDLTTSVTGNGSITLDPSGGTYDYGTVVTLTAVPDSGWYFETWKDDLYGGINPTTIIIDSNKTVTARFTDDEYSSMVSVPSGTFTQEDTGGNSFTHSISAFELGKYGVTYELWYAVRTWGESNGYIFSNPGREGNDGTDGAVPTSSKYEPVTYINWRDAMVWCNAYSEMDGYTPVYENGSGIVIKDSRDSNGTVCDNAVINPSSDGYQLPTEGQWQYAASYIDGTNWLPSDHVSGDESAPYDSSSVIGDYAWYSVNSGSSTHDVGMKLSNHLGIHDMSGNVFEWCWDWKDDYPAGPETDYEGAVSGSYRVLRGGSWNYFAFYLPVGSRNSLNPSDEYNFIGFRVSFPVD